MEAALWRADHAGAIVGLHLCGGVATLAGAFGPYGEAGVWCLPTLVDAPSATTREVEPLTGEEARRILDIARPRTTTS